MISVKMLETKKAKDAKSPENVVKTYEKGQKYEIFDEELAEVMVSNGWAKADRAPRGSKKQAAPEAETEENAPETTETEDEMFN